MDTGKTTNVMHENPHPVDVEGEEYQSCGNERGKPICIYQKASFTCGASSCKLGEQYPCILCAVWKYLDSAPEWHKECLEKLHAQYPHGCPHRKMAPSLKIGDRVLWTSSPTAPCEVVEIRDGEKGREVKLWMPHWGPEGEYEWWPQDECVLA